MKDIVVIYHSPCLDGFGGAYAAWKKFGDNAEYVGMRRSNSLPDLKDKEVYFIDFTPTQAVVDQVVAAAKRVTILDHHIGSKETVESVPVHVFDNDHSGATIAWGYFFPEIKIPRMFEYLEDIDLWRRALPQVKEVSQFLSLQPFEFIVWDKLVTQFEDEAGFAEIKRTGAYFAQYYDFVTNLVVNEAFLVEFEGYTIPAANVPNFFSSAVGNRLWKDKYPFALTWYTEGPVVRFSLRGDGSVDLSKLAQKYGGNGHAGAAGFQLPPDAPLPFKRI